MSTGFNGYDLNRTIHCVFLDMPPFSPRLSQLTACNMEFSVMTWKPKWFANRDKTVFSSPLYGVSPRHLLSEVEEQMVPPSLKVHCTPRANSVRWALRKENPVSASLHDSEGRGESNSNKIKWQKTFMTLKTSCPKWLPHSAEWRTGPAAFLPETTSSIDSSNCEQGEWVFTDYFCG